MGFIKKTKNVLVVIVLFFPLIAWAELELPMADKVLVDKSERKLWLISNGNRYREYEISLGDNPEGHKQQMGDERTPEGNYVIDYRNPHSRFHLSLHISYPNAQDKKNAAKKLLFMQSGIWKPEGFRYTCL